MRSRNTRTAGNKTREELAERNRRRRERKDKFKSGLKLNSRQKKRLAAVLVVLLLLFVTYGRPIIKLRIENAQLEKQNEELQKKKSAIEKELKNVNSKDYIKEQARKQLRLLDKDEIIFNFEEDSSEGSDETAD